MELITDLVSLKRQIAFLEQKQELEKSIISLEVNSFIESLRPINLIRGLFRSINSSPDVKSDILHGIVGLGTGFLTNKLLLGSFHGPIKKILATVIQAGITNAAVKYPETIKNKTISFLTKFLQKAKFKTDLDNEQYVARNL